MQRALIALVTIFSMKGMAKLRVRFFFAFSAWLFLVSCTTTPVKQEPPTDGLQAVEVDHKYFKILYSPKYRLSAWVEYAVTKGDLKGPGKRRDNFHKDKILESMGIEPVGPKDYPGKQYDRGHMAPQTASLNRRAWEKLEARVRTWICGEEKLTIVSGPILKDGLKKLDKGIAIPERFFKVVYDETPPLKSIAFIYLQSDDGDPYKERIADITEIEKETNLRFPKRITDYPQVKDIGSWNPGGHLKIPQSWPGQIPPASRDGTPDLYAS